LIVDTINQKFDFGSLYDTVPHMNTVISPVKSKERSKLGIRSGDTVRVHQKVIEKGKTRIQIFEGLVIAVKHGSEAGGSFTVRATLSGVGVEKIFPLYTPLIDKIEIVKRSKVRRAKLYFIREKAAKAVRRQLRNARMMNISTDDFAEKESEEPEQTPEVEVPTEGENTAKVATADETTTTDISENTPADDAPDTPQETQEEEKKEEVAA